MNTDLILETISEVADNTKHPISDRLRLIENLFKLANNSKVPKLDTTRESE